MPSYWFDFAQTLKGTSQGLAYPTGINQVLPLKQCQHWLEVAVLSLLLP